MNIMAKEKFELPPVLGGIIGRMNELHNMVAELNDWFEGNVPDAEQTPYVHMGDAESHLNWAIQSVSDFMGCMAKGAMYGENIKLPTSTTVCDGRQG